MTTPRWQTSTPIVGRDEDWLPVEGQVGTVITDQGLRVALELGETVGIFVPGADVELHARLGDAIAERQAATEAGS